MKKLIHPLLMLIAQATEKELVLYIEYLKAENRILRSKLPKKGHRNASRTSQAGQAECSTWLPHQGSNHNRPSTDLRSLGQPGFVSGKAAKKRASARLISSQKISFAIIG